MSEEILKQLIPLAAALGGAIVAGGFALIKDYLSRKKELVILEEQYKKDIEKIKINLKNDREKEELQFKRNQLCKFAELVSQSFQLALDFKNAIGSGIFNVQYYRDYLSKINELRMFAGSTLCLNYNHLFVSFDILLKRLHRYGLICGIKNDKKIFEGLNKVINDQVFLLALWKVQTQEPKFIVEYSDNLFPTRNEYQQIKRFVETQLIKIDKLIEDSTIDFEKDLDELRLHRNSLYKKIEEEGNKLSSSICLMRPDQDTA